MKRSTASWTTAVAASALLALPVGSWAQQPTPSTTPRQQTTGAPAPQTGRTPGAETTQGSANEHLRQAQSALADIPAASLTGTAKTRVAELKRHLNALEQAASQKPAAGATSQRSASWSGDVAAANRILSELLNRASTTGGPRRPPRARAVRRAAATRQRPHERQACRRDSARRVGAHQASGRAHPTHGVRRGDERRGCEPELGPGAEHRRPEQFGERQRRRRDAIDCRRDGHGSGPGTDRHLGHDGDARRAHGNAGHRPADPAAAAAASAAQSPTQPPAATPATPSPTPSQQVDAETVKRHLTAARDTLSQLTQLPAAAQLTGDARTQVSQLISNFNELITTNADWRAAYTKLQGNLTALVGEPRADESPAPAAAPAATPGAVGTSGTTAIDPAIRAKLVEFRAHLAEFEKAAGGSGTPAASASASPAAKDPSAQAAEPSAAASATATPAPSASSTATTASSTTASPASSTTASPAPAATTGRTAETPATAGTSGTGTPTPAASEQASKPSTSGRDAAQAADGHRAAMTHIEAIEAILNGASPAGTSGTASKTAKPGTLEHAQIEEIRNHLAQLRKELEKGGR